MVSFVSLISGYAKSKNPGFIVIPQNGASLINEPGYTEVIDGIGQEDFMYGYDADGELTPDRERKIMESDLISFRDQGKIVLITNYVFSQSKDIPHFDSQTLLKIKKSEDTAKSLGFLNYCTVRNLNYLTIPPGFEPSVNSVTTIPDIKEFAYMIQNPENQSKDEYVNQLANSDYDLVIMDMTYDGLNELQPSDIAHIKNSLNHGQGGKVICYMSIGEAESYRYYWQPNWTDISGNTSASAPLWLCSKNPDWDGNYKVRYWMQDWQNIILGSPSSYLDKILSLGFDGVYLDIIDAFEYFEQKKSGRFNSAGLPY